jgi:predicted KAP-like P-loop ATPase
MMLESLRSASANVHAIEFNPWEWSSQDRLFEAFFREIGTAVGRIPGSEARHLRHWAERLREYGAYLRAGATVAHGLGRLLAPFVALLGAGWLLPGLVGLEPIVPLYLIFAFLFFAVAGFLRYGGRLADDVAEALLISSDSRTQTIADLKASLQRDLQQIKYPIVVIIDDIDRLPADQILSMFQLVKANVDFPGMVYVLLFDRIPTETALKKSQIVTSDFIEKIVQVGFDVPVVERMRLERVLFTELNTILAASASFDPFQEERWSELFFEGLRPYFQTMRQVKRYTSSLSFHMLLLARTGTLEVNFIDLIALEALRVFEGALYRELPKAKDLLTGRDPYYGLGGERATERKKALLGELLNSVPEERRSAAGAVLHNLFPATARLTAEFPSSYDDRGELVRHARVCSPEFFDRYFQLSIPEDDISRHTLSELLSATGAKSELLVRLESLRSRGLLEVALDRLEAHSRSIEIKDAEPFVTAMFEIGDWLKERDIASFTIDPIARARRVLEQFLRQEEDPARRGAIIVKAASHSSGLRLPVELASNEEGAREKGRERLMDESQLERFKALCVERLKAAARDGTLLKQPDLLELLYRWRDWAGEEEPRQWVASLLESSDGVVRFLVTVTTPYRVNGKRRWRVRLKYVEDFADVQRIEEVVSGGFPRELQEDEKNAIREFHKALGRRRAGKADDPFLDEDVV